MAGVTWVRRAAVRFGFGALPPHSGGAGQDELWGEGAVVSTCMPTHQLAGVVETNRRPNVGDRWTRIAVRAVWRVAAIPGSGRGGRAEPYILYTRYIGVFIPRDFPM